MPCVTLERGLQVDHTTIYRWVQHYAPELEVVLQKINEEAVLQKGS